jgi:iron complex transport system permease protein
MSTGKLESTYSRRTSRWKFILLFLIAGLFVTVLLSLNAGYAPIPFGDVLAVLGKQVPFLNGLIDASLVPASEFLIVLSLRLPRIIAGVVVGAALAASGVVYQGVFRNPMADSYILGVSSGAAVGASIAIMFGSGIAFSGFGLLQVAAFIGAILAMFLVYNISRVGSRVPVTTLLLNGIAVNFFLYAIVALLEVLAGHNELSAIVSWLIGGFGVVKWLDIWPVLPFIIVGIVLSYFYARDLNMLALGEDQAQHLGVNVEKTKRVLLVLASMVAAAAVSLGGLIGFVGLMVPHITRIIIGPDHRILFPASAIMGAIYLVVCDALARVVALPFGSAVELPVGIVTMLAGAPFFVILFRRKKQNYAL